MNDITTFTDRLELIMVELDCSYNQLWNPTEKDHINAFIDFSIKYNEFIIIFNTLIKLREFSFDIQGKKDIQIINSHLKYNLKLLEKYDFSDEYNIFFCNNWKTFQSIETLLMKF